MNVCLVLLSLTVSIWRSSGAGLRSSGDLSVTDRDLATTGSDKKRQNSGGHINEGFGVRPGWSVSVQKRYSLEEAWGQQVMTSNDLAEACITDGRGSNEATMGPEKAL